MATSKATDVTSDSDHKQDDFRRSSWFTPLMITNLVTSASKEYTVSSKLQDMSDGLKEKDTTAFTLVIARVPVLQVLVVILFFVGLTMAYYLMNPEIRWLPVRAPRPGSPSVRCGRVWWPRRSRRLEALYPKHDPWDCQSGLPIRPGVVLGVNVIIYGSPMGRVWV